MNARIKTICIIVSCALAIGLAGVASAAVRAKKALVYCPKVEFVCKPCSETPNPPSSTAPGHDTCCSLVTTGWEVCSAP